MRSQVQLQNPPVNSPQAPIRTRRRAQSVAVQGVSQETQAHRRVSLFESNVSWICGVDDSSICIQRWFSSAIPFPFSPIRINFRSSQENFTPERTHKLVSLSLFCINFKSWACFVVHRYRGHPQLAVGLAELVCTFRNDITVENEIVVPFI